MLKNICKLSLIATALFLITSCEKEEHLPGLRIDVLANSQNLIYKPDVSLANTDVNISDIPATNHTSWLTRYGNYNHINTHFASSNAWDLEHPKSISIGTPSALSVPQTSSPLIKNNILYTLDAEDNVQAYDLTKHVKLWNKHLASYLHIHNDRVAHGGITIDDNSILYVATGYGYLVAMDSKKGQVKWQSKDYSALRSTPIIANGMVIITTITNDIIALNQANGKQIWQYKGPDTLSSILRTSTPVIQGNNLLATTSDGNVLSLNLKTGVVQWQQSLGVGQAFINSRDGLTTIVASPIISGKQLFVANGKYVMESLDPTTGRKQWTKPFGTLKTPTLVGDWLFVIDKYQKLMAIHKKDGLIKWSTSLPNKDNGDAILWTSPIISSESLLTLSTNGALMTVDITNGSILQLYDLKYKVSAMVQPFIINHKLYITGANGKIYEYNEKK